MIVCVCNSLSDRHVRSAAENGANSPSEVYRACGCRPDCGVCAKEMRRIVNEVAYPVGRHPAVLAGE